MTWKTTLASWKITMHCRGGEEDWALSEDAASSTVLGEDKTLIVRVLGDHAFSATLTLAATSALTAIVEALVLINRELQGQNMPDWPAVEICAEPVDQGILICTRTADFAQRMNP